MYLLRIAFDGIHTGGIETEGIIWVCILIPPIFG